MNVPAAPPVPHLPPGTKTKSIFIDRQKKVLKRGSTPAAIKRYTQEWNRKNANQKQAWLNEHRLLAQQQARAEAARERYGRVLTEYRAVSGLQRGVHYGREFGEAHRNAIAAARSAREAFDRLQVCYVNLRNVENQQPDQSAQALMHSVVHAALCVNAMNSYTNRIARLARERRGPFVPQDPSNGNRRRLPAHWYPGHQHQYLQADDHLAGLSPELQRVVTQNVGLHPVGLQWRPWLNVSNPPNFGHLWLGFDVNDVVQDRVFRKDIYFTPNQWTDPRLWEGDVRNPLQKLPFELSCNDALLLANASHVVRIRGGVHAGLIDNTVLRYKVYLEWCRLGDLRNFIELHRQAPPAGQLIPEPMIWYVAEALATAGRAMESGQVDEGEPNPMLDWDEIVHRDIKPQNVFLDEAAQEIYPDYPKPVLGDFGLAFKTSDRDPNNPFFWKTGAGTEGFRAPEQFPWIDQITLEPLLQNWRVTSKTDVFAVGMVLRCLVLGQAQPNQPYFLGDPAAFTDLNMLFPSAAIAQRVQSYSDELRTLIDSCLRFDPAQRPTFQDLLARVRGFTDENLQDRSEGMRGGDVDDATMMRNLVVGPADVYRLGLARMYLPAQAL